MRYCPWSPKVLRHLDDRPATCRPHDGQGPRRYLRSQRHRRPQYLGFPWRADVCLAADNPAGDLYPGQGFRHEPGRYERQCGGGAAPIAGILLTVAAGGGFKQILVDTGIAKLLGNGITQSSISPLLMAWLVAVVIRLATGSATVATVTAAGILEPVAASLPSAHAALPVLAIGCGSVFFSHVNDAGFWLIKEYFGISVGQTIKSWSLMETALSVCGVLLVLLVSVIV